MEFRQRMNTMPDSPAAPAETAAGHDSPRLQVTAAESFNYAAWQNAAPLLRSVTVVNPTSTDLSLLAVELEAIPPFAAPKRWTIERIGPEETIQLRDIDIDVDAQYLDRLDEAERAMLRFRLLRDNNVIAETTSPIRVLARDEWGGMDSMAELLPAFVTPNDPALAALLKTAAGFLGAKGHSTALDGYQSGDPARAYMLAAALWSAVCSKALTYANPPPSFEHSGQKARGVATVLGNGLATCLDSTLLFASGLEAMGLRPVIVMTQGHCFAGVWLVDRTLNRLVERESSDLRKAIAAQEFVAFETTLVTGRPPARFPDAVAASAALLDESREDEFVGAVDISRGRMAQIRPLASHGERRPGSAAEHHAVAPELPRPPEFDGPRPDADHRPSTPAGRIDRWQRKLLDLSLRNRLLNFRATKQAVPVLCPDLAQLEDRLADGGRLRLTSLRDDTWVADRDPRLHRERTRTDLETEFARRALEQNELACPIEARDLEARLTTLYRKGKNDLAEGGSNTIYLAVGFLRWRPSSSTSSDYRAPLLLLPVQLIRRSASSPYYLASHEDEVRFNATLLQLLKKDFGCDLTALESNLPVDDSGVDVPRVLERVRQAVRDIPGFEVVEEAAIASFSFAKYLMWKDLVDRVGQLDHNRVVRHLVHDPDKPFVVAGSGPMPGASEIDTRYTPADIVHPLPADSSQLAAVMAAAEGHDMVIVGPPGTGKSQTIANLIAQCLSAGKTVLFVAEKTAALDVVHRRLREHGLADCCVELHSNKAERRRFLDQLQASWNRTPMLDKGKWDDVCKRLRVRRDELNAYVAAAHETHPNGWTVHRAMGLCVHGRDSSVPQLDWSHDTRHDRGAYEALEDAIADVADVAEALPKTVTLERVHAREWSMAWESSLLDACRDLEAASAAMDHSIRPLAASIGIPEMVDASATTVAALRTLARNLADGPIPRPTILLRNDLDALLARLEQITQLREQHCQAREALAKALDGFGESLGLAGPGGDLETTKKRLYPVVKELRKLPLPSPELVFHRAFDALPALLADRAHLLRQRDAAIEALEARSFNRSLISRIPTDQLLADHATAAAAFWPLSLLRQATIRKQLRSYMAAGATPTPEVDLALLAELQACQQQLADNLAALALPDVMARTVDAAPASVTDAIAEARRIRDALLGSGTSIDKAVAATGGSLHSLRAAAEQLIAPDASMRKHADKVREQLSALDLPTELRAEAESTPELLAGELALARQLRAAAADVGLGDDATRRIVRAIADGAADAVRAVSINYCQAFKAFHTAWQAYTAAAESPPCSKDSPRVVEDARSQAVAVANQRSLLRRWVAWHAALSRAKKLGVEQLAVTIRAGELPRAEAISCFRLAYARWWLIGAVDAAPALRGFQRFRHEGAIEDFRRLDDLARDAAASRVLGAIHHGLPAGEHVPRKSELGMLRHQLSLKRPSRSIREMIGEMPASFCKLAPCLLMSPLSIAQYLPAGHPPFDVVVFDEASQIATWDAVGAIARGKQTIIVGDPKQLPPTNFFGRADSDDDAETIEDFDKDLESILDESKAAGLPTIQLNWHYRSRHESLIAFSNRSYYGNHLVTFPAAESEDRGVSLTVVEEALYDRGKSRTNQLEAERIVADAVSRMKRCMTRPEAERLTYGVVTFNSQQQSLIQDLFDEALRSNPELEWFFADERVEPTAVKNLENVQGDERDVMYFSITFGRDAAGKFPVDFGAINRDGGERRLNVAITRARRSLLVYASFMPDQLRAERSSARGVHDLKAFLDYAFRGPESNGHRREPGPREPESALEPAIAAALESRGWRVDRQVGVSGFRVDLGVAHPDRPGEYLAGVECDGATYRGLAAARDRDKTSDQVLANLGWRLFRVWAPDWWHDPVTALDELHAWLEKALRESAS
jgi:very-short-patch-repair endonuclease